MRSEFGDHIRGKYKKEENTMKITQELIDNGQKIIHLNYEKSDIEKLKKMHEEQMAKLKAEQEANNQPEEGND